MSSRRALRGCFRSIAFIASFALLGVACGGPNLGAPSNSTARDDGGDAPDAPPSPIVVVAPPPHDDDASPAPLPNDAGGDRTSSEGILAMDAGDASRATSTSSTGDATTAGDAPLQGTPQAAGPATAGGDATTADGGGSLDATVPLEAAAPNATVEASAMPACSNGAMASCAAVLGAKGACAAGMTMCVGGSWGACSIQPATDTCDRGNDNSCDGVANDPPGGCTCLNGATQACGACGGGSQACSNGAWGPCLGANAQFTFWRDADGDGFGDPNGATVTGCSMTPPSGYAANNKDCCDTDFTANPNQTGWFSTPDQCGSFDYDCSGAWEGEENQIGPSNCGVATFSCIADASGGCVAVNCMNSNTSENPACAGACTTYGQGACGTPIVFNQALCAVLPIGCSAEGTVGGQLETLVACH